jgi:hypothetical protein
LAQLEECRQQKAQIQAELAQKEAQIFELSQLVGDEQNLLFFGRSCQQNGNARTGKWRFF